MLLLRLLLLLRRRRWWWRRKRSLLLLLLLLLLLRLPMSRRLPLLLLLLLLLSLRPHILGWRCRLFPFGLWLWLLAWPFAGAGFPLCWSRSLGTLLIATRRVIATSGRPSTRRVAATGGRASTGLTLAHRLTSACTLTATPCWTTERTTASL